MNSARSKTVVGWTEYVGFPDWEIKSVQAKVDTGARTSALHVENLEELDDGRVRFDVITRRKKPWRRRTVECDVVKWARVRSSTGVYCERCFVLTRIRIGEVEKEIEISLVSREKMLFRMLLGRKALEHDFVVDVSKRAVISEKPVRKKKKISVSKKKTRSKKKTPIQKP